VTVRGAHLRLHGLRHRQPPRRGEERPHPCLWLIGHSRENVGNRGRGGAVTSFRNLSRCGRALARPPRAVVAPQPRSRGRRARALSLPPNRLRCRGVLWPRCNRASAAGCGPTLHTLGQLARLAIRLRLFRREGDALAVGCVLDRLEQAALVVGRELYPRKVRRSLACQFARTLLSRRGTRARGHRLRMVAECSYHSSCGTSQAPMRHKMPCRIYSNSRRTGWPHAIEGGGHRLNSRRILSHDEPDVPTLFIQHVGPGIEPEAGRSVSPNVRYAIPLPSSARIGLGRLRRRLRIDWVVSLVRIAKTEGKFEILSHRAHVSDGRVIVRIRPLQNGHLSHGLEHHQGINGLHVALSISIAICTRHSLLGKSSRRALVCSILCPRRSMRSRSARGCSNRNHSKRSHRMLPRPPGEPRA
jgi:hypothetical protein